jgi:hypothetical protein
LEGDFFFWGGLLLRIVGVVFHNEKSAAWRAAPWGRSFYVMARKPRSLAALGMTR